MAEGTGLENQEAVNNGAGVRISDAALILSYKYLFGYIFMFDTHHNFPRNQDSQIDGYPDFIYNLYNYNDTHFVYPVEFDILYTGGLMKYPNANWVL